MGLFIRQDDDRSELQQRLAAELRARAKAQADNDNAFQAKPHDGVDDSNYLKDTKTTTSLAWVWVVIFILIIAVAVWIAFKLNG